MVASVDHTAVDGGVLGDPARGRFGGALQDLHRVAEVSEKAGLAIRVAHLKPLICVKG
jgi:hypothetical protein